MGHSKTGSSTTVAARLLGLGLCGCALIVSREFGFFFTTAKFLIYALSFLLLSGLVLYQGSSFVQIKSSNVRLAFLGIFLALVFATFQDTPGERLNGLSHILLFVGLSFVISALAQPNVDAFLAEFLKITAPFAGFTFLYFVGKNPHFTYESNPLFGNPNVASNFIAIGCLQVLFLGLSLAKASPQRMTITLCALTMVLGLTIIVFMKSRGAALGLGIALAYTILSSESIQKGWRGFSARKKSLLIVLGGIGLTAGAYLLYVKGGDSLSVRHSFWRNTLCLIRDHPLGVGPGSFEYVFQLYNGRCYPAIAIREGYNVRNPHNMFLEFMAEIGIAGGLLILLSLYLIGKELLRMGPKSKDSLSTTWLVANSLLLLSIGFWEFPQDTPYTSFFMAACLGIALAKLPSSPHRHSKYLQWAHFVAALFALALFSVKAYSDHLTFKPGSNPMLRFERACKLDPESWRACVFWGLAEIQNKNLSQVKKIIEDLEARFKDHHSVLHLKGSLAEAQGDQAGACHYFRDYHDRFNGKTRKSDFLEKNCPPKEPTD